MTGQVPTIGRQVHYIARGSADGVFPPAPRAATVTEVDPDDPTRVGLAVVNPTGLFFHPLAMGGVVQADGSRPALEQPGSWCWPPRV